MHDLDFTVVFHKMPSLLQGAWATLYLSVISLLIGLTLGIILALLRDSKLKILSRLSWFYIWVFRGTPLMIQLYIFYFGLPSLGIKMSPVMAGICGMSLNTAAYIAEIVRSGIHGVDSGQREAAKALGMSPFLEMIRIVTPQATKLCLLPLINQFVATIKNSSILSVVTIIELTRAGTLIAYSDFRYFEAYIAIAIMYLALTTIFTSIGGYINRRLV